MAYNNFQTNDVYLRCFCFRSNFCGSSTIDLHWTEDGEHQSPSEAIPGRVHRPLASRTDWPFDAECLLLAASLSQNMSSTDHTHQMQLPISNAAAVRAQFDTENLRYQTKDHQKLCGGSDVSGGGKGQHLQMSPTLSGGEL